MSDHFRRSVSDFHRAMGVPRFHPLNRHERMACAAFRSDCIQEEGRELVEADVEYRLNKSLATLEHLAKEIADLLYVTAGTADILRTPLIDPMEIAEMPQFFAEGLVNQRTTQVMHSLDLLVHQIDVGWRDSDIAIVVDEIGSELQDVANAIAIMAKAYDIPLRPVFDAVHESNMSKLDPETGVPLFRADGKILKGPAYRPANLSFLARTAA